MSWKWAETSGEAELRKTRDKKLGNLYFSFPLSSGVLGIRIWSKRSVDSIYIFFIPIDDMIACQNLFLFRHPKHTWTTRACLVTHTAGFTPSTIKQRKWPFRKNKEKIQDSSPVETKRPVFWPGELLPSDLQNARIISYGYNSTISTFFSYKSTNHDSILQHAKNMMMDIVAIRENVKVSL